MKKYILSNLLFCGAFMFYSCAEKKIGDWDDNIKLSTKTVQFNSIGDSATIKTGGDSWWLTSISVGDKNYSDFKNINVLSSSYSIKEGGFLFKRVDKNTIFVKADENTLNTDRIIRVGLEAGDYFDGITITQKSKN